MCRLLITAIFAAAMWPVAAYANQTLAAFSPPSSSPVVINACGASLATPASGTSTITLTTRSNLPIRQISPLSQSVFALICLTHSHNRSEPLPEM